MSENQTNLSPNIAAVLFSKNTPVSLRLYLANSVERVPKQPFEMITHNDGQQYYLAKLSLGEHFYERDVLLKLFDKDDLEFNQLLERLRVLNKSKNNPFSNFMCFGSDDVTKQSFSPLLYCKSKLVFFHPHCDNCQAVLVYNSDDKVVECKFCAKLADRKKQYAIVGDDEVNSSDAVSHLIQSLGSLNATETDMPCIRCEKHEECYQIQDEVFVGQAVEKISVFSLKSFSLVAFEHSPLSLLEFNQLASGLPVSEFKALLHKQNDIRRLSILSDVLNTFSHHQINAVRESLNYKLNIFLKVCDIALKLEREGESSDKYILLNELSVVLNVLDENDSAIFSAKPYLTALSRNFMGERNQGVVSGKFPNLSHLFLSLLLSNSVLGEDEITHASNILYSKFKKISNEAFTENYLNTIIHRAPALSVVFRQENTLYKPGLDQGELIPDVHWLQLLGVAIKISGNVISEYSVLYNISALKLVKKNVHDILAVINKSKISSDVTSVDEESLIRAALDGVIKDASWLEAALSLNLQDKALDLTSGVDLDKTKVYAGPEKHVGSGLSNETVDRTIIMPKKR